MRAGGEWLMIGLYTEHLSCCALTPNSFGTRTWHLWLSAGEAHRMQVLHLHFIALDAHADALAIGQIKN